MKHTQSFEKIKQLITQHTSFVLLSHVHTDGDALGSLIALYHYLKGENKQVSIFVPGDLPEKYNFLEIRELVNLGSPSQQQEVINSAEVIFILDISNLKRLDIYYEPVKQSKAQKVMIDHHPAEPEWVSLSVIDTEKIATAELIFDLFHYLKTNITIKIARALYTAILADSGSFRFYKTSAATFRMAAELVQVGVEPSEMYSLVFETAKANQLRNWGKLLSNLNREQDRSWLVISKDFMHSSRMGLHEFDGLIDIIRRDAQANIFAVFVEKEADEILVGLRSKNGVDVGSVARSFGGGGHYYASGFTSSRSLDETVQVTLDKLKSVEK